ncbi:hypothetical protein Hamer_G021316 [Homarus americanus]|uniref:Uncharacterized protein n=1 Tax=Homarus americanus TaxID=6706 RepID=A0A8J5JEK0_HOMAM|nr:hypothetical protein Hamer_G021316 [Homarus americanus]
MMTSWKWAGGRKDPWLAVFLTVMLLVSIVASQSPDVTTKSSVPRTPSESSTTSLLHTPIFLPPLSESTIIRSRSGGYGKRSVSGYGV